MKKLTLRIDALAVESFAIDAARAEAAGTVEGHAATRNQNTCQATCEASCFGSCDYTCQYTCNCVFTEPRQTCLEPCIPPPID